MIENEKPPPLEATYSMIPRVDNPEGTPAFIGGKAPLPAGKGA